MPTLLYLYSNANAYTFSKYLLILVPIVSSYLLAKELYESRHTPSRLYEAIALDQLTAHFNIAE